MDWKAELSKSFVQIVVPALCTGLAGLLGWAMMALRKKFEAQAEQSKIAAVGTRITHLADVVVADLNATVKPAIVEAAKDGVLTAEEAAKIKSMAMDRLKALIAEKGMAELSGVLGIVAPSIETYLSGLIEQAVAKAPVPANP